MVFFLKGRRKCVAIAHCMKMKKAMVAATSRNKLKQHPRVAKHQTTKHLHKFGIVFIFDSLHFPK